MPKVTLQIPRDCNAWHFNRRIDQLPWKKSLPFNINPRGILVHRVKSGTSHLWDGQYSHDSLSYWCGNGCSGKGVALAEVPPEGRVLCERCELVAVQNGQPTADELAGRHVHVGVVRAHRTCCTDERN